MSDRGWLDKDYGYSNWIRAREELTRRLHGVARAQSKITYSELCDELRASGVIDLEPHGVPFAAMLGQINVLEQERGRPMISAVVVHKTGDYFPGVGFWNVAKEMGVDIGDTEDARLAFWAREFTACHAYWKNRF